MGKKSLQELRKFLEELKTIKISLVSKSKVYAPYIKEIDGIKYISLEDLVKGQFITNERYICTLNNGEQIIREKIQKSRKDGSAVIIIPVGGAAAGVANARCAAINNKHIRPEAFKPTIPAKL